MRLFLIIILAIPILLVVALSFQDSQKIKGTIQEKHYQEKECTQEITYNPALNMVMPEEKCDGPYWTVTINNKKYKVSEALYNKLEIDSFYSFSYHPLKGMSLLNE